MDEIIDYFTNQYALNTIEEYANIVKKYCLLENICILIGQYARTSLLFKINRLIGFEDQILTFHFNFKENKIIVKWTILVNRIRFGDNRMFFIEFYDENETLLSSYHINMKSLLNAIDLNDVSLLKIKTNDKLMFAYFIYLLHKKLNNCFFIN